MDSENKNVCRHNKFGFCKFGKTCKKKHLSDICVNLSDICVNLSCRTYNCLTRHPRDCYFYGFYGRCKFGNFCQFRHVLPEESKCENFGKLVALENKVKDLEAKLEQQQSNFIEIRKEEINASMNCFETSCSKENEDIKAKEIENKLCILELDNSIVAD